MIGHHRHLKAAAFACLGLAGLALPTYAAVHRHAPVHGRAPATMTWYASWAASPMDLHSFPPAIIAPSIEAVSNQTSRQWVTLSRGGAELRLRLSNEFGAAAVHIGAASIGYRAPGASTTRRIALTFGGADGATMYAGAPLVSDPVPLKVPDGVQIEISLYLPDQTPISTVHVLGLDDSNVSGPGNFTMADALPDAVPFAFTEKRSGHKFIARPFLAEVDVAGPVAMRTVVAFGDSITDGMGSALGEEHRWPDYLARRIVKARLRYSVIDQGIGGNQVLLNGIGVSALGRLDQDVLAVPGASAVILMEGINDIGFSAGMVPGFSRPDLITPEEIIQGYRQIIARCHARGLKIIGATMTPFGGSPAFTPAKETVRLAVNRWILTSGAFDSVVDFDRVVRDPQQPDRLRGDFDSGDHIHPDDAGYQAMAAAIDLKKL